MWLRKYLTVFKLSWERLFEYRFNLLMGTVRSFILLVTFYFLWTTVFASKTNLFGFSQPQILTYVLGANFLSSLVFIYAMDKIAGEIFDGRLSLYLIKPISFLGYWLTERSALRLVSLFWTIFETLVFVALFRPALFYPENYNLLGLGILVLGLSVLIFTLLDFIFGLTAFWTQHAYGPRFAFKMLIEFTSGRFFPLSILPPLLFKLTNFLPFSFLVFFPLNVYLGRLDVSKMYRGLATQAIWVVVLSVVLKIVWSHGLRRYEAVGG